VRKFDFKIKGSPFDILDGPMISRDLNKTLAAMSKAQMLECAKS